MDLSTKLTEANAALHALTTGQGVASITRDGKRVEFRATNIKDLQIYIQQLTNEQSGKPRRRGFRVQL